MQTALCVRLSAVLTHFPVTNALCGSTLVCLVSSVGSYLQGQFCWSYLQGSSRNTQNRRSADACWLQNNSSSKEQVSHVLGDTTVVPVLMSIPLPMICLYGDCLPSSGADIMMVKPGMPYLDVVRQLRDNTTLPIRYDTHTRMHLSTADGRLCWWHTQMCR